jgi:hypothetical protein
VIAPETLKELEVVVSLPIDTDEEKEVSPRVLRVEPQLHIPWMDTLEPKCPLSLVVSVPDTIKELSVEIVSFTRSFLSTDEDPPTHMSLSTVNALSMSTFPSVFRSLVTLNESDTESMFCM